MKKNTGGLICNLSNNDKYIPPEKMLSIDMLNIHPSQLATKKSNYNS